MKGGPGLACRHASREVLGVLVLKLVCSETVVVTVSRPAPNTRIFIAAPIAVASPQFSAYSLSIV